MGIRGMGVNRRYPQMSDETLQRVWLAYHRGWECGASHNAFLRTPRHYLKVTWATAAYAVGYSDGQTQANPAPVEADLVRRVDEMRTAMIARLEAQ